MYSRISNKDFPHLQSSYFYHITIKFALLHRLILIIMVNKLLNIQISSTVKETVAWPRPQPLVQMDCGVQIEGAVFIICNVLFWIYLFILRLFNKLFLSYSKIVIDYYENSNNWHIRLTSYFLFLSLMVMW